MRQGFEWPEGGQATGNPDAPPVDLWEVDWPAWPTRSAGHIRNKTPRV